MALKILGRRVVFWSQQLSPGSANIYELENRGTGYAFHQSNIGDVDLGISLGGPGITVSDTLDWWDVTLGARLRGHYDNGWSYAVRGDIAGAGLESDFSVQAIGTVGRDFRLGRADLTAFAGYRLLYQDWEDGADAVDLLTHGPLLGLRINF